MSAPPPMVDQVLARHPWPKEHAQQPRLPWLWHFELPLSVPQLRPLVADGSRLNRALGVTEMKFEERGEARWGTSRPGDVSHEGAKPEDVTFASKALRAPLPVKRWTCFGG